MSILPATQNVQFYELNVHYIIKNLINNMYFQQLNEMKTEGGFSYKLWVDLINYSAINTDL